MKTYDLSKLTVLIIDKQQPMRTLLRQILREFGVGRIFDASTPEKGFEEFVYHCPDLVLVDWCPEFDGIGLLKRIRTDKNSPYPQVPVIMVSAYNETNRVFQARDAGMSEYVVKPVSPSLLYVRIVNVIENPRPFIRSENYVGPCRRRHKLPFAGKERRKEAAAAKANVVAKPAAKPERAPATAPAAEPATAKAA